MHRASLLILALAAALCGTPLSTASPERNSTRGAAPMLLSATEPARVAAADLSILPLIAGIATLAASGILLVLAALRRGRAVGTSASDERAAMMRRRTRHLGRVRLDDDPIVASLGGHGRRRRGDPAVREERPRD